MLHDPLAESRRCPVERDRVDPTPGSEVGEGDDDADPQIFGEPRRRPVVGGRQEGDIEIAVGPRRAPGAGAEYQECGDSGDRLNCFADAPQISIVHGVILAQTGRRPRQVCCGGELAC